MIWNGLWLSAQPSSHSFSWKCIKNSGKQTGVPLPPNYWPWTHNFASRVSWISRCKSHPALFLSFFVWGRQMNAGSCSCYEDFGPHLLHTYQQRSLPLSVVDIRLWPKDIVFWRHWSMLKVCVEEVKVFFPDGSGLFRKVRILSKQMCCWFEQDWERVDEIIGLFRLGNTFKRCFISAERKCYVEWKHLLTSVSFNLELELISNF